MAKSSRQPVSRSLTRSGLSQTQRSTAPHVLGGDTAFTMPSSILPEGRTNVILSPISNFRSELFFIGAGQYHSSVHWARTALVLVRPIRQRMPPTMSAVILHRKLYCVTAPLQLKLLMRMSRHQRQPRHKRFQIRIFYAVVVVAVVVLTAVLWPH
jgi:hypothetical protein